MTVTSTQTGARPRFLTEHSGTRGLPRERVTPVSREPVTGRYGEVFHAAAEGNATQLVSFDRPPDIDPNGSSSYTYAAWAVLVDEAASWLRAAGVEPWDRVAILKRNHLDVSALESAAARIGAIACPMAEAQRPEFAKLLLERLERPVLITDRERLESCELDEEALRALTKRTIVVDGADGRAEAISLDDLRGAPPVAPRMREWDEPMFISHTSGTTGPPKLVMHSATSIRAQSHVETERWPGTHLTADDRVAFCDPFFHTRVHTAIIAFATVGPRLLALSSPDPENVRGPLATLGPTIVETLPNMYMTWERLAREPKRPFRDTRLFISSFDAIHTRTIRALLGASERRMPVWIQSWSQSENGALALRPYVRASVRRVGAVPPPTQGVGWPQPLLGKVRAVDPQTGQRVPRGEEGLIEISLPGRCLTYVGESDRHDLKVDGEWWHTGDMGVISRTGGVRLVDREVDRMPGGSCIEMEDLLLDRLPQTTEVIVLSVPDALPQPVYSTDGDAPVAPDAWAAATEDLPPMADPIKIGFDDFPRTATWKIRRNQLREELVGARPVGIGRWT
jgi:acyl-coenzyme A synthetase/AMP-(fatty) acid ligase